jgi:hypothetical protein
MKMIQDLKKKFPTEFDDSVKDHKKEMIEFDQDIENLKGDLPEKSS